MNKKKIIALVLILLVVGVVVYFIFFNTTTARPWEELTAEEKINVFEDWFAGQGSVYIRPGTNEFNAMVDEVQQLYADAGIPWDEELFIQMYEEANGAYNEDVYDHSGASDVTIDNRPGTNEYNQ